MKIVEAKPSEAEQIVEELWLPLAREMEEVSDYNELENDLDLSESVEHKKEKIESEDGHIFIAKEDKEMAGYISLTVKESAPVFSRGDKLKISELFIKEEYRRKGYASELIRKADKVFQNKNCSTIELEVNKKNESAKELYEKNGFEVERFRMIKEED